MRMSQATALLFVGLIVAPPAVGADQTQQSVVTSFRREADSQAAERVRVTHNELEKHERTLKSHLARAQELRERALPEGNQLLLNRAEQLERQAFAEYQKHVEQFQRSEGTSNAPNASVAAGPRAAPPRGAATPSMSRPRRLPDAERRPPPKPESFLNRLLGFGRN